MAEFLTRRFACAHVDRGYGARYRWRRGPGARRELLSVCEVA